MEIIDKKTERLPQSATRLTVRVGVQAIRKEYERLLGEWRKRVRIDGFRMGKAPTAIIEQKYARELRHELEERVLNEAVHTALDDLEQKPLHFSQPRLEGKPAISLTSDLSFSVVYDVFPEINVGVYRGLTINIPTAVVERNDIEREIEIVRERNAVVYDVEKVTKGVVATIEHWELDAENQPIEATRTSGVSIHVGSDRHPYKLERNIIGMKIGNERTFRKKIDGKPMHIGLRVMGAKMRQLPTIDNDLARDVSDKFKTLAELRADIQHRLQTRLDQRIREISEDKILDQALQDSEIELPESMIAVELIQQWKNFVARLKLTEEQVEEHLKQQDTNKAELLQKMRPSIELNIRKNLLVSVIIEREKIEVNDDEVSEYIGTLAEQNSMEPSRLQEFYRTNNQIESLRSDLRRRTLFDRILAETNIHTENRIKLLDLMENN